jgi:hypothetical protein
MFLVVPMKPVVYSNPMGHGKTAGKMAPELREGREEETGNLPEAVGEGTATFRGMGYLRGGLRLATIPSPGVPPG